jgi:hypothetical protein
VVGGRSESLQAMESRAWEAGIDVDESPRARLAMMSLPSIGTESAVLRE